MILKRSKKFSSTKILNTNAPGFIRGRKYDTDLDRLGRMKTSQRELSGSLGELEKEKRKMTRELNNGSLWQRTD